MNLTQPQLRALAMFRDRPDPLTWMRDGGWSPCFLGVAPFVRIQTSTVRSLAARGLIVRKPGTTDREAWMMVLSDAGETAAADLPRVYDHQQATIELHARWMVDDAIRRATKGTRRRAVQGAGV